MDLKLEMDWIFCVFAGTLRVRVVYRDVRNVPRNHIR
jgi:hypothetical protein